MELYPMVTLDCGACSHTGVVSLKQPYYWHECNEGNVCHVLPRRLPKAEHVTLKEVTHALRTNVR